MSVLFQRNMLQEDLDRIFLFWEQNNDRIENFFFDDKSLKRKIDEPHEWYGSLFLSWNEDENGNKICYLTSHIETYVDGIIDTIGVGQVPYV